MPVVHNFGQGLAVCPGFSHLGAVVPTVYAEISTQISTHSKSSVIAP